MYQLTAAHPTLPLPSYARVTNTINGRQVIVRVNDRGPFIRGRIIDLSYAAAVKLGYLEQGSTMVEIESITAAEIDALAARGTPAPVGGPERMLEPRGTQQGFPLFTEREGVFVQLGAFAQPDNAEGLRARLLLEMSGAIRSMQIVAKNGLHRLWVGPYRTQQEARSAAEQLASFFR
jgi:rare lipoprotein A